MAQDGQMTCITGGAGSGKTALVEVMLGLLPLDEGMVSVDGELLTPLSAPTFRRMMAYVPQQLVVPDDYHEVPTDYLSLLKCAVESGKMLLLVDEPSEALSAAEKDEADQLLREVVQRGAIVLAVNARNADNTVEL
jgi:ABC-type cobalamin/Fe3+-siderophores transport system ATPase subunit